MEIVPRIKINQVATHFWRLVSILSLNFMMKVRVLEVLRFRILIWGFLNLWVFWSESLGVLVRTKCILDLWFQFYDLLFEFWGFDWDLRSLGWEFSFQNSRRGRACLACRGTMLFVGEGLGAGLSRSGRACLACSGRSCVLAAAGCSSGRLDVDWSRFLAQWSRGVRDDS